MTSETQARHTFNTQRALVVWSLVIQCVFAGGIDLFCAYLLLIGREIPSPLALAATAVTTWVFRDLQAMRGDYMDLLKGGVA